MGFQKSAWVCDQRRSVAGHDRRSVATPALPDLQPAIALADAAPPRIVVQGRRAPRPSPRGRRTPQNQPEASPGLGRPGPVRRADPTPSLGATRSSTGHPGHGPAVAPPAGGQEVDLSEPLRSPTPRPDNRRTDRAHGPRERDLGLPAHPGRTAQARPSRRRIHDPPYPQAAADTSRTAAIHRHVLATVPPRPGLDHAGRGLLPRRLRDHPETDLRLLRPRGPQPATSTSSGRPAIRAEPGPPSRPATS